MKKNLSLLKQKLQLLALLVITVLMMNSSKAGAQTALIYGPMLSSPPNEQTIAASLGLTVTVVNNLTWQSMTTAQFSAYSVIIIPDDGCNASSGNANPNLVALNNNKTTWSPAVKGRFCAIGTDPDFHDNAHPIADVLAANAIGWAANGNCTGMYYCTSCNFYSSALTTVNFLSSVAPLSIQGASHDNVNIPVAALGHPVVANGVTSANLSAWSSSIHANFSNLPANFYSIANDVSTGLPYIIGCDYLDICCGLLIDDNNACTIDGCDPITGVYHLPINCDDGNPCTTDACDPSLGCVHTPVVVPDDGQGLCTIKRCNPSTGAFEYLPVDCNDGNPCTTDACDPLLGCVHMQVIVPDDGQGLCTIKRCNPSTGVFEYLPVDCNDGNPCTVDACDPIIGCFYTPVRINPDVIVFNANGCTGKGGFSFLPSGGTGPYSITVNPCPNLLCQYTNTYGISTTQDFPPGTYTICFTDAYGCNACTTVVVKCTFPFSAGISTTTCFNPSADATLSEPFPNNNLGTNNMLFNLRWTWANNIPPPAVNPTSFHFTRSLINFNLSTIPVNSVTNATLQLFTCSACAPYDVHRNITASTDNSGRICKASSTAWTENTVTWNNGPTPLALPAQVAIGPFAENSTTNVNANVTGIVQDMVNTSNNGFIVKLTDETTNEYHSFNFASRENVTASIRPLLCVTYFAKNISICAGSSITLTAQSVAGVTYKWYSLPSNLLIASTRTKVIAPLTSGCYVVIATNACGCTASDTVCVNLKVSVTTSSDTTICKGSCATLRAQSYVTSPISLPISFLWSPGGQTTQNITVCPTVTTTYTVRVTDGSGCSATAKVKVTVKDKPATPGTITGSVYCLCGTTATYCTTLSTGSATCPWTVPAGATIISGQGTNCITISFGPNFVSGVISIACGNECGMSLKRSLTVYGKPAPAVINGPSTICLSQLNASYLYTYIPVAGCPITNYVWSVTNGLCPLCPLTNSTTVGVAFTNPTASVHKVCLSVTNSCGASTLSCKNVTINNLCRISDGDDNSGSMRVSPNPAHDELNVKFTLTDEETYTLQVMDITGRAVLTETGIGSGNELTKKLDVHSLSKGIYVVQLITPHGSEQTKALLE